MKNLVVLGLWLTAVSAVALAQSNESIHQQSRNKVVDELLKEWKKNPKDFYSRVPRKSKKTVKPYWSQNKKSYVSSKNKWRNDFSKQHRPLRGRFMAEPTNIKEQVEMFVDQYPILDTLQEMEARTLLSAETSLKPWSDHYWPIYSGGLGLRYADPNLFFTPDWKDNFDLIQQFSAQDIFKSGDQKRIDQLSPSEKYDLLLGSKDGPLTHRSWQEGKTYYDHFGSVERWMGICHGWAPASYMLDRPSKPVQVMTADNQTVVTFYPADVKALASLLWAKTSTDVKFLGSRCNDKEPPKDTDANGRLTSNDCFDVNPGIWHMTLINQLGLAKKNFVMDATYDYEVWNQPILKYEYTYFNPLTGDRVDDITAATVRLADFDKDPYKKYRGKNSKTVVGIAMNVLYVVETHPQQLAIDDPSFDATNTAFYLYDLELDDQNKIVGGEWYSEGHPDFFWTPTENARALSHGDILILNQKDWDGRRALNQDWRRAALTSVRQGQPLARIVESLINLSQ